MSRKTVLIDTNILVSDANSLFTFKDCEIVLPFTIIEELDKLKSRPNEVGANARETARILLEFIDKNGSGSLSSGVDIGNNCILKVMSVSDFHFDEKLSNDWDPTNKDNHIIDVCRGLALQHKEDGKDPPILLTKDIILRVKCDVLGIPCEGYNTLKVVDEVNHLYSGAITVNVDDDVIQKYWEAYGSNEKTFTFDIKKYTNKILYQNEFIILNDPKCNDSPVLRYFGDDLPMKIIKERKAPICNLTPRNKEQNMVLDLLMDDNIKLVSISGISGGGKSLCALAAGLEQVLERHKYKSLIICRPTIPVGQDLGFLPGELNEKLAPWVKPIKDNIKHLLFSNNDEQRSSKGKKSKNNEITLQMLEEEGLLEIEAISYIRGRTISNAFIIIEESQNTNLHELKTIITRAGENSKVVVVGDLEQVDSIYLDSLSCGMAIAIEKFKQYDIAGHISFVKSERSRLCELASKIL